MEEAKPQHNMGQWNLNWNLAPPEWETSFMGWGRRKNGEYSRQGGKLPSLKNTSSNLSKKYLTIKVAFLSVNKYWNLWSICLLKTIYANWYFFQQLLDHMALCQLADFAQGLTSRANICNIFIISKNIS